MTHSKTDSTHELIYMVETQRAPCVVLTWLNNDICTGECSPKGLMHIVHPVLFVAIKGSHIVDIGFGYLPLICPTVALFHHTLNAGAIASACAPKDTIVRQLTGFFRRNTFVDKIAFRCFHANFHFIGKLVVVCRSCHLHSARNQKETGGS